MSDCHPGKFSKMGGKCPTVILANFQKREENVQLSSWQIFKNWRKVSDCHPGKFSKTGEKCVKVMLSIFSKTGGNCAFGNFCNLSKLPGGKCPLCNLAIFPTKVEVVF